MSGSANTSKNTVICHSCANDVVGEFVPCQGFCNAVFHIECCGTNTELLKNISSHRQIFWTCKSCSNLMSDLRHRRSVQCAFEAGQELSLSHHNRIVEQLKSEILSELKNEISANFDKLISSNSLTPSRFTGGSHNLGGRRLFANDPKPAPVPGAAGNAGSKPNPIDRIAARDEGPRFWLYLSRVSRRVTEEQIRILAIDRLGDTDIAATRLVAKGRDVSRMKFISFKVGMHVNLRDKALSPSTWPEGLVIREFEERSGEKFWEPSDVVKSTLQQGSNSPGQTAQSPQLTSTPPPKSTPKTMDPDISPMSTTSSQNRSSV